jgi:hypothetical protein
LPDWRDDADDTPASERRFAENGIAAERSAEIDTRYADRMLRRLVELQVPPVVTSYSPAADAPLRVAMAR